MGYVLRKLAGFFLEGFVPAWQRDCEGTALAEARTGSFDIAPMGHYEAFYERQAQPQASLRTV